MVKTRRLITISLIIIAAASSTAFAQGEAGAGSLIIPPGARANAMGQSFGAIADDATAMWWNPAGMAFAKHHAIDLMHSQLVPDLASDVYFDYLAGIYKIKGIGTIGFAIQYLTYGEWTVTDEHGIADDRKASSWEIAPMIGGALKLGDQLSIGMNLKFIYISLAPAWATLEGTEGTGSSVAVDFGAMWVPDFGLGGIHIRRMSFGLTVSNLGPSITFMNRDQAAALPRNLRLSFAWTPLLSEVGRWILTAEVNRPMVEFDRSNTYHAGTEFLYANLLALRVGYVHDHDGNIKSATYGIGVEINNRVRVDYANVPQSEDLARVHRWSLGVNF